MKLLYLLKKEPTTSTKEMIKHHKETADVMIIDIRENKNYSEIIDHIFNNDKVICC